MDLYPQRFLSAEPPSASQTFPLPHSTGQRAAGSLAGCPYDVSLSHATVFRRLKF